MKPYKLADELVEKCTKVFVKKVSETKANILRMDEINTLDQIDLLYRYMYSYVKKGLKKLWCDRFFEMLVDLHLMDEAERRDIQMEPEEAAQRADKTVDDLLAEPNEVTHYSFDTEILRKRDRCKEAVLSVPTKAQKQLELEKALRIFMQMVSWYADFTSQDAEIEGLKEAGVKKVVRHEREDDKVCDECREADGDVYPIDKIPPLPHPRCRRWFTKY